MSPASEPVSQTVLWEPQPGPQNWAIRCAIEDILYGGARGGGKTDWILADWVAHQNKYGSHASGLLFRRTFEPEMKEIIKRSKELYPALGARYNKSDKTWTFPNGSELSLRHMEDEGDADNYIGHQYTWVGFDQLERWTSADPSDKIRGSMRSAHGIPCVFRATANPGGVGHQWVKDRYITEHNPLEPFYDEEKETERIFIPSKLKDNQKLMQADPNYVRRLKASGPKWLVQAWLDGNWDIVPGAYYEDIWDPARHIVAPFIPPWAWPRWRALDWGFARPYSVGWYTQDFDGVIYRYREIYGWGGKPNKGTRESAHTVADKIRKIEALERAHGCVFRHNPAGVDLWGQTGLNIGNSTTEETLAARMLERKVAWVPAKVGGGSRVQGAMELAQHLYADTFKVTKNCKHWLRTVPVIMPDPKNVEDVDTDSEDHCFVGDTVIITRRGPETLRALVGTKGEVMTLAGWRPYQNARRTGRGRAVVRLTFTDGSRVTCTPDHKFMNQSGKWIQAGDLLDEISYTITPCKLPLSKTPSRSFSGFVTTCAASISAASLKARNLLGCIASCGRPTTDQSRRGFTSTISTTTVQTTISKTLPWSLRHLTCHITRLIAMLAATPYHSLVKPRHSGTAVMLAGSGTLNTTTSTLEAFTPIDAWLNRVMCVVRNTIQRKFRLGVRNIARVDAKPLRCVSVEPAEVDDVYCLTVPSVGHFTLSNHAVVHNCYDETRYSLRSRRVKPKALDENKGPKPGSFDHLVMLDERQKKAERNQGRTNYRRLT